METTQKTINEKFVELYWNNILTFDQKLKTLKYTIQQTDKPCYGSHESLTDSLEFYKLKEVAILAALDFSDLLEYSEKLIDNSHTFHVFCVMLYDCIISDFEKLDFNLEIEQIIELHEKQGYSDFSVIFNSECISFEDHYEYISYLYEWQDITYRKSESLEKIKNFKKYIADDPSISMLDNGNVLINKDI